MPQPESAQVSNQDETAAADTKAEAAAATADEEVATAAAREQEKAAIRKQIEAVKKKRPTELDLYGAFEERIDLYEQITRQITLAMARRDTLLRDIEYYQNGLGQQLRQISDTIIDGEVNEEPVSAHEIEISPANSAVAESTTSPRRSCPRSAKRTWSGRTCSLLRIQIWTPMQAHPTRWSSMHVPDEYSSSTPVPLQATGAATTESPGELIDSAEGLAGSNFAQSALSPIAIGPLQEAGEICSPPEPAVIEPAVIEPAVIEPADAEPVLTMPTATGEPPTEEGPGERPIWDPGAGLGDLERARLVIK